ncbi:lactosylceramide 4-alpha-galactosyltransferase-like [Dermacentor variabilis]|uniref:lactosylceramide 4-alpha-galactosyltransferase-like n=1 Tax=Dermacentor variabilis TaxID=34621 RepID=UPI003F5C8FF0
MLGTTTRSKDYQASCKHRLFLFLALFSMVTTGAFVWGHYHVGSLPAFHRVESSSKRDIWLLETSGNATLNARQACSIESAAIHNPEFTVRLLSTGNMGDGGCPYYSVLLDLPNFIWAQVNVKAELAGTPLEKLLVNVSKSPYAVMHLSDFLRYVLLWKRGGVYLDTDTIVTKPLAGIRNSVVYANYVRSGVCNAFLFFDANHAVLDAFIKWCARTYAPDVFTTCGRAITAKLLSDTKLSRLVTFLHKSTFAAICYWNWRALFSPNRTMRVLRATKRSYGVHFWNFLSKSTPIVPGSGCAMDFPAEAHCPRVYKVASQWPYF